LYVPRDCIRRPTHLRISLSGRRPLRRAQPDFVLIAQDDTQVPLRHGGPAYGLLRRRSLPPRAQAPWAGRTECTRRTASFVTEGTLGAVQSEVAVPPFRTRASCKYSFKKGNDHLLRSISCASIVKVHGHAVMVHFGEKNRSQGPKAAPNLLRQFST
jgi:hypothetical protein